MNIFDAKIKVLVRNFYQLLKLEVNQNSRITSGFNSSEAPVATLIAMDSLGWSAHLTAFGFALIYVWILHAFQVSISWYVWFFTLQHVIYLVFSLSPVCWSVCSHLAPPLVVFRLEQHAVLVSQPLLDIHATAYFYKNQNRITALAKNQLCIQKTSS